MVAEGNQVYEGRRGRYEVITELGRGAQGAVLKAIDISRSHRPPVAIKRVIVSGARAGDFRRLIAQEARILEQNAGLPFVPNFVEYWSESVADGDLHILVMEFIDGVTVDKIRELPWGGALVQGFLQIMLYHLSVLHSKGLVHRDIKPENIKKADEGYILLDFGVSTQNSQTIVHGLTPRYAAPEQFLQGQIDGRADVYCLAATAYHLLTGEKPPPANERMQGKRLELPARCQQEWPALCQTLNDMLELAVERRPTAEDALARLRTRSVGQVDTTPPDPPSETPSGQVYPLPDTLPAPEGASTPAEGVLTQADAIGAPAAARGGCSTIGIIGRGRITDLAWSPDSRSLAVGTAVGVFLWSPQAGGEPVLFRESTRPIRAVGVSLAGTVLALVVDQQVQLWSLKARQLLFAEQPIVLAPPDEIGGASLAANGEHMLAISEHSARLWRFAPQPALLGELQEEFDARTVALAADGRTLVAGSEGLVRRWRFDSEGFVPLSPLRSTLGQPLGVAVSADGETVAAISMHGLQVWAGQRREPQLTLDDLTRVRQVAVAPDGRSVAVAGADGVVLYSLSGSVSRHMHPSVEAPVGTLAFSPDGAWLAAASEERLWVWRLDEAQDARELVFSYGIEYVRFSDDGATVVTVGRDLQCWGIEEGQANLIESAGSRIEQPRGLALARAGRAKPLTVAVASARQVEIWQAQRRGPADPGATIAGRGTVVQSRRRGLKFVAGLESTVAQCHSVVLTSDGKRLLIIAANAVQIWEWDAQRHSWHPRDPFTPGMTRVFDICDVALSLDGGTLAICEQRRVHVWNLHTRREILLPPTLGEEVGINTIALTPDGRLLALGSDDGIEVLQLPDGTMRGRIAGEQSGAQRLIFAHGGRTLAAIRGSELQLRSTEHSDLPLIGEATSHTEPLSDAAFSNDGRYFATVAYDGTMRIWRLEGTRRLDLGKTIERGTTRRHAS